MDCLHFRHFTLTSNNNDLSMQFMSNSLLLSVGYSIHTEIQVLYRMMAAVPSKNDYDKMLKRWRLRYRCRCRYGARLEMDPAGGGRLGD